MRMFGLVMLGCLLTLGVPQRAAANDGNGLLNDCAAAERVADGGQQSVDAIDAIRCVTYVEGIGDMNSAYRVLLNERHEQPFFCQPDAGLQNQQAARIVVKYLRAHPERLHEPAVLLVTLALSEAFPCRK